MVKLLGIDYGAKRVGIALSNVEGTMAFPYKVIDNNKKLLDSIESMLKEEEVSEIVIGESIDYKGSENPVMKQITAFADELKKRATVPVHFEPETLTTSHALREQGRGKLLDASAAALILNSFIEKRGH